jgi:hypothetical protein
MPTNVSWSAPFWEHGYNGNNVSKLGLPSNIMPGNVSLPPVLIMEECAYKAI